MKIGRPSKRSNGALGHLGRERLTVPAVFVLKFRYTLGLDGTGQDHGRAIRIRPGLAQRLVNRREIMAINYQCPGTEGFDSLGVAVKIPLKFGWPSLA